MGCKQSAPVVNSEQALSNNSNNDKDRNNTCCNNGTAGNNNDTATCCPTGSKPGFSYNKGVCALSYWEPIQLLAEGSISSIHLIRRRPHRVDVTYDERKDLMARVVRHSSSSSINGNSNHNDDTELRALKSIMKDHVGNVHYLEEMRKEIDTLS